MMARSWKKDRPSISPIAGSPGTLPGRDLSSVVGLADMQPRLDLRLSQKLVMTPQLQQAIKLLQLSRLELQDALTQQLEENPMLEEAGAELDEADTEIAANDETPAVAK